MDGKYSLTDLESCSCYNSEGKGVRQPGMIARHSLGGKVGRAADKIERPRRHLEIKAGINASGGGNPMKNMKLVSLGFVAVSVIMFFVALATDVFWLAQLVGQPFPSTMPIDPRVHSAFAVPDIVLSILLYIGAYGLIRQTKTGFILTWVAMGMWIFDSLLVLGITGFSRFGIVGPCLFFAVYSIAYLWQRSSPAPG